MAPLSCLTCIAWMFDVVILVGVARLMQGRDTLPENTWDAAGDVDRIHPGARRYLAEIGLQ
jgi:hypothetical protein